MKKSRVDIENDQETNYTLPGGETLKISEEKIKCAEAFFQPNLINLKIEGIHKYIFDSIQKCDFDIRKELMKNIVLSGGSTLFSGMKERLKREI